MARAPAEVVDAGAREARDLARAARRAGREARTARVRVRRGAAVATARLPRRRCSPSWPCSPAPASSRRPAARPTRAPPRLVATRPDSFAVLPDFKGDVEFQLRRGRLRGRHARTWASAPATWRSWSSSPRRRGCPSVQLEAEPDHRPARARAGARTRVYRVRAAAGRHRPPAQPEHERRPCVTFTHRRAAAHDHLIGARVVDWTTSRPAPRRAGRGGAPARQPPLSRAGRFERALPARPACPTASTSSTACSTRIATCSSMAARRSTPCGWRAGQSRSASSGRSCTTRRPPRIREIAVVDSDSRDGQPSASTLDPGQRLAADHGDRAHTARLDADPGDVAAAEAAATTACIVPRRRADTTRRGHAPRGRHDADPAARRGRHRGATRAGSAARRLEALTSRPALDRPARPPRAAAAGSPRRRYDGGDPRRPQRERCHRRRPRRHRPSKPAVKPDSTAQGADSTRAQGCRCRRKRRRPPAPTRSSGRLPPRSRA